MINGKKNNVNPSMVHNEDVMAIQGHGSNKITCKCPCPC